LLETEITYQEANWRWPQGDRPTKRKGARRNQRRRCPFGSGRVARLRWREDHRAAFGGWASPCAATGLGPVRFSRV